MDTPIREYRLSRHMFNCSDHGRGGRSYWDHSDVTWRFWTKPTNRVAVDLYAQPSQPGNEPATLEPESYLGSWDLGPLSTIDQVLSGQIDIHGQPRPEPGPLFGFRDEDDEDPRTARPGYLVHETDTTGMQRYELRTLSFLELPVVCDALGHLGYQGYIARCRATAAASAERWATESDRSVGDQYASILDDLCAPRD